MSEKLLKKLKEEMTEITEPIEPIEEKEVLKEVIEVKETVKEDTYSWVPKTKLGKLVKDGKIKNIDEILNNKMKILEPEIVDSLINVENDLLFVGQSKGKFGGGKRRAWRQAQKKTKEGNVITFSSFVVVGDKNGHVGLGFGKAKETLPAREKALRKAKLNLIKVKRGSGSFEGSSHEAHSIPFQVSGKCGSVKITLVPAPQGTGLVIGNEGKKILKLAGIQDIYSKSFGHKRTTMNYGKAVIDALRKLEWIVAIRISGMVDVNKPIENTLYRLRMRRKYSCVILPQNKETDGMLKKIRNFISYGDIDENTLKELIEKRGESVNKKEKVSSEKVIKYLKENKTLEDSGIKPFFRLHPPRGGINSKAHCPKGVLGENKEINELIRRML